MKLASMLQEDLALKMQTGAIFLFFCSPGVGGCSQQVSDRCHRRHVVGRWKHAAGRLRLVDQGLEDADDDYDSAPSGGNHMLAVRGGNSHQLCPSMRAHSACLSTQFEVSDVLALHKVLS